MLSVLYEDEFGQVLCDADKGGFWVVAGVYGEVGGGGGEVSLKCDAVNNGRVLIHSVQDAGECDGVGEGESWAVLAS